MQLDSTSADQSTEKLFAIKNHLVCFPTILNLSLDLRNNKINFEGCQFLANMIGTLGELGRLAVNLSGNPIGSQGVRQLKIAISKIDRIHILKLDLSKTRMYGNGLKELSKIFDKS